MKHYGDITKINGEEVPLVDIITGGSPCQDLSIAKGNREGLSGKRSGLFMEQIRVIKEMRNECARQLRVRGANDDIRLLKPRFMVFENVPGAFSSNKGEDFRCVLEETARIVEKDAIIPRPKKWENAGCIVGNGWSIAYRVHDAQYWGVPQRRRRLCLVADFNGESAGNILFELFGEAGEDYSNETYRCIGNRSRSEIQIECKSVSRDIEKSRGQGKESACITSGNIENTSELVGICVGNGQLNQVYSSESTGALNCMHDQQAVITYASFYPQMKAESQCYREDDVANTLVNGTNPGFQNGLMEKYNEKAIIRRITPLECERLQGYPDGYTNIGDWVDSTGKTHKTADTARYKALGNSIALPFWQWLADRMVNVLKEEGVENPTMGSLFDGVGGFPLVYSRAGCKPVWASEIEEFPMAVTKKHFGED